MNLQNAIAAKLASPTPGTNAGSANDVTSILAETLLLNAVDIAPHIQGKQVPRGWYATEETRAELNARWRDSEDARKRVRSLPSERGLHKLTHCTS